jgi:hypothetical protein
MAEKTTTKKRSTAAAKQELQTTLADVQRDVQERQAELRPEDRIDCSNIDPFPVRVFKRGIRPTAEETDEVESKTGNRQTG